uniref:Uncharacterized protein n=1 Tax=Schistocephalus solidus TaxID=70667 RepID=A0A0X3P3N8_SCHSO
MDETTSGSFSGCIRQADNTRSKQSRPTDDPFSWFLRALEIMLSRIIVSVTSVVSPQLLQFFLINLILPFPLMPFQTLQRLTIRRPSAWLQRNASRLTYVILMDTYQLFEVVRFGRL